MGFRMLTASANNSRHRVVEWTRLVALAQFLILGLSLLCSPRSLSAQTSLLGVYYGNQGWAMSDVRNLEAWQNKKDAVLVLFTDWCNSSHEMSNLFGQQLHSIWNNGNVPMITWMPQLCSNTPSNIAYSTAGGQYDSYLKTWTAGLKEFLAGPDGIYGSLDDRRV
jgi:mannan endo-1,4-beta-mannosidase